MKWVLVVGGALLGLMAVVAIAWAAGWGPFGDSLEGPERAVVDAVERRAYGDGPSSAATFVDDNLSVLVSAGVADAAEGADLADLFTAALAADDSTTELLGGVAAAIADEGIIHADALTAPLAEATALNMSWFDEVINAPWGYDTGDAPNAVQQQYLDVHDFLREVSRDEEEAETVRRALYDYSLDEVANAPEGTEPQVMLAREDRLAEVGRIQAFFDIAQYNAGLREADGADGIDAADSADERRREQGLVDRCVWIATDRYDTDPSVRDAARGQPFVDADGNLKSEMSAAEAEAFRQWAYDVVQFGNVSDGSLRRDEDHIGVGADDVANSGLTTRH